MTEALMGPLIIIQKNPEIAQGFELSLVFFINANSRRDKT